jgi:hypothetical protein
MSNLNSFVLTNPGETIQNTPIIKLDNNNSVVYTDNMGRQTVISLSQQPVTTIPIQSYAYPPILASRYEYQDVNEDSDLHQKVMKKIYTNIYNFIIPNEHPYMLNYIKKNKGDYSMVKNIKEFKATKTKEGEYENKLQYMAHNIYSKSMMYNDVKQYLETYDIKWFDIEDNKTKVYEMIIKKLKRKLADLAS